MDTPMDSGLDGTGQRVEIGEAARRLGISTDGVRKRLKRGQIAGGKTEDGHWYVIFPAESIPVLDDESSLDAAPGPSSDVVDRLLDRLDERDRRIEALERERAEIYGRTGYLQAQLEAARERIKLLEGPKDTQPGLSKTRRWWQWWKH